MASPGARNFPGCISLRILLQSVYEHVRQLPSKFYRLNGSHRIVPHGHPIERGEQCHYGELLVDGVLKLTGFHSVLYYLLEPVDVIYSQQEEVAEVRLTEVAVFIHKDSGSGKVARHHLDVTNNSMAQLLAGGYILLLHFHQ